MDKMTDSEIVKDLNEAEDLENVLLYCKNPNKEVMIPIKITDIRDLINRLQAENKELKKELAKPILATKDLKVSFERIYRIGEEKAFVQALKAEAYKEFAERLKRTFPKDDFLRSTKHISKQIDNLLKELVGE